MANNIFTVKNLSFSYGKQQVLNGLDFSLHEGKITTLIGANGCGKSTLFNLMTKNLKPDQGEVFLREENIANLRLKDFAREAAIVHQYNTAPPDLTVEKLVSYGRTPYHTMGLSSDPQKDEEKIQWALEITHTSKHKDKPVTELSGGQKQRVWIAMALAQDTKVLFLDEPTTYLDVRYQLQILKLIQKLNREYGITIVMVLHDINQSLYYSDEIVAMKDGRIIAHGLPEEIISKELVKEVIRRRSDHSVSRWKTFCDPGIRGNPEYMERRHKPYETKKNGGGLSESRIFAEKAKQLRTWCGYCSRASCVASYSFRFAERVGEGRLPFFRRYPGSTSHG